MEERMMQPLLRMEKAIMGEQVGVELQPGLLQKAADHKRRIESLEAKYRSGRRAAWAAISAVALTLLHAGADFLGIKPGK